MTSIAFISIHPRFIEAYMDFGVFASARQKNLAKFSNINLRDFAVDKHGSVDSLPYGGGEGMVLRPEPLAQAVRSLSNPYVIMTSPQGRTWTQDDARRFVARAQLLNTRGSLDCARDDGSSVLETLQDRLPSPCSHPPSSRAQSRDLPAQGDATLVFVCGRFSGVDQRFIDHYVDEEFSLGDFIVSGGELPALTMVDSILRLIPGVLGNEASPILDSFEQAFDGGLEHSLYTRPREFEGEAVPAVLLSGNHRNIELWRHQESLNATANRRPDLSTIKS